MKKRFNPGIILLFIPLLIIGFSYFELERTIRQEKFKEKWLDIKKVLDRTIDQADVISEELVSGSVWENSLIINMSTLDSAGGIFAALYDKNLNIVSERTVAFNPPFDPFLYPDFQYMAFTKRSGELDVPFHPMRDPTRKMKVYFQWYRNYLLVTGMSVYSVETHISSAVTTLYVLIWGFSAVTLVLAVYIYLKAEMKNLKETLHDTP